MFKVYCQKDIPISIKMQTYCLVCRKNSDNISSKKVAMTVASKVIRDKSKCTDYMSNKSRFLK